MEGKKPACWQCLECAYVYDPEKGDPKGGIPPGTDFLDLPDTWRCPECRVMKAKKGLFVERRGRSLEKSKI
jgi:rubredoxin